MNSNYTGNNWQYFLSSIPGNSPLLYDLESLELFSNLTIFFDIKIELERLKNDYKEIRGLIYSHGEKFRIENFGNFYFQDFLWAL